MAANIETMFYTRTAPWHGLGTKVDEALTSKDALIYARLDWQVLQEPVYTSAGELVSGYKANVRDTDRNILGIVSDRYKIVQNEEAFSFTDALLGEGVKYETAGSIANGKIVWMLAKMPQRYIISGDAIEPYLVLKKKKALIKYKKVKGASNYQVQYSMKKNFAGAKTKTAKGNSLKVSGLKVKKKYYFRVRVCKKVNGKTYYSGWSNVKSVKAKK